MVDISAISGALASLKAANDIAGAMIGLRDATAFQAKLIEFQSKIIEAQQMTLAAQEERASLLQRIRELETKIVALEAERRELDRYQLKDFGGNTFAYELKEAEARGEPIHRVCANCLKQGHISILQFSHNVSGQDYYKCDGCKTDQKFGVVRRERTPSTRSEYF